MCKYLLFISILIIIVIGLVLLLPKHVEEQDSETVVAIVYGQKIKYSSIQVTEDHPAIQYKIQEGMLTEEQLPDYILEKEKENLIFKINGIILQNAIEELNIIVTNDEMNDHIDDILASITDSQLNEAYERHELLIKALKEAFDSPDRITEIYNSVLKPHGVLYDVWQSALEEFTTMEAINEFEKNFKKAFTKSFLREQYEKNTTGFRKIILKRKFFEQLVKDISVSDDEVVTLYKERHKSGRFAFNDVNESLRQKIYLEKKKKRQKEWWQEGIKNANISIEVNKFRSIVNEMLERTERAVYVGP